MLLKNIIDTDDFIEKITIESSDKYYKLLYNLLFHPSVQNMDTILSYYPIIDLINSLKHLIKFKFNCLTDKIKTNIIKCVEILLQYSENVDTLIINALRIGLVEEITEIYKNNERLFEKNKMAFPFLAFHLQDPKMLQKIGIASRDFYLKRVLKQIDSLQPFTTTELESLSIPTQMSFISSGINIELEMNTIFISNVKTNFDFYKNIIIDDFITTEEVACRVLRFCVYIPFTNNLYRLTRAIVEKFPQSSLCLIYDLLFYNGKENISILSVKWLEDFKTDNTMANYNFKDLKKQFPNLEKLITNISKGRNIEDTVKKIYNLHFQRYIDVINEMKSKNTPFIEHGLYEELILISQDWDNYMQVYLWKIFAYQKILFGFDIPEVEIHSNEAKEGAEIISNLIVKKQRHYNS